MKLSKMLIPKKLYKMYCLLSSQIKFNCILFLSFGPSPWSWFHYSSLLLNFKERFILVIPIEQFIFSNLELYLILFSFFTIYLICFSNFHQILYSDINSFFSPYHINSKCCNWSLCNNFNYPIGWVIHAPQKIYIP